MSNAPSDVRPPVAPEPIVPDDLKLLSWAQAGNRPILSLVIPPDRTVEVWHALESQAPETRWWRVHDGRPAYAADLADSREHSPPVDPRDAIREAEALDLPAVFAEWRRACDDNPYFRNMQPPADWPPAVPGSGLARSVEDVLTVPLLTGLLRPVPADEPRCVLLVPAAWRWEVPGWLGFGYFNDCPPVSHHVAVARQWQAEWGSRVVGFGHDILVMTVERMPASQAEAMDLAWQHAGYCPYVIEHCSCDTIHEYAARLMTTSVWHFWWD